MLWNVEDVLFSVMISYMGAIELFFVMKQIIHLAFQHEKRQKLLSDSESMKELQERIENEIAEADKKEILGFKAMKDGVLYKDGFRIDPEEIGIYDQIQERQVIGSSATDSEISKEHDASLKSDITSEQEKLSHEKLEEVCEEPCIKKVIGPLSTHEQNSNASEAVENERTNIVQSVKTQFGQNNVDSHSSPDEIPTPICLKKAVIEENPSPLSKTEDSIQTSQLLLDECEREAPDGEDFPQQQYTEDYLRSLDGIKHRPIIKDDGTGRRRAFRRHRSSESTSSRESRASREEELKVFTSLEEAESESIRRGESEYTPIKYSNEQNARIGKHQKRHRRSPVKWADSEEQKSLLGMLDEEDSNPWGDIKPEHYKETEFWKKEKKLSIQEENESHVSDISEGNTDEFQHAGEVTTSPSPTKNFPKLSSFEEATPSQNEDVVAALERQKTQDKEEENVEDDELDKMGSVSKNTDDNDVASLLETLSTFNDTQNSAVSSDMHTIDQSSDRFETQENALTINYPFATYQYETYVREKEKELFEATARFVPLSINNPQEAFLNESLNQLTELPETNKITATNTLDIHTNLSSLGEQVLVGPETSTSNDTNTSEACNEIDVEINENKLELETKDETRPRTPVIEIDYAPNESSTEINKEGDEEFKEELDDCFGLMDGISDFYDFNASINPSRSPSTERQFQKSLSPIITSRSVQMSPTLVPITAKGALGVSDFYDYNVMLNRHAYGYYNQREREAHTCSVDYILDELKSDNTLHESRLHLKITKDGEVFLKDENDGIDNFKNFTNPSLPKEIRFIFKLKPSLNNEEIVNSGRNDRSPTQAPKTPQTPYTPQTPLTPQYTRSFSSQSQYLERLKDEYRSNVFKRSTYVGESMDFSDDFEELREQTRHFRRSGSKSRSPVYDKKTMSFEKQKKTTRELQDKILEEITKTTMNYQDFPRDINQKFLEHERRGSDSVLLQKPKIFIELQDNLRKKDEFDDDEELSELEAEEYHHFRRFSLNQECPTEQYPDDDYIYIEQIEVRNSTGARSWMQQDYYDVGQKKALSTGDIIQMSFNNALEEDERAEAEDLDSASDDERQTIIEVNDEIDEDIWDYERPEELFTEQSECEDAEREMDRYANHNAGDWKDNDSEGAVNEQHQVHKDSVNIEEMYDDAVKNTEESGIQKDYENIIEEINKEEKSTNRKSYDFDSISVKTEDILEEILREDEEKYGKWSSNNEGQIRRNSSTSFIEEEMSSETSSRLEMSTRTSSTRLRSRYGFGISKSYKTYDNLDNVDVDLNYQPKKEYKWRQNFKLDEDDSADASFTSTSPEIKIETVEDNSDGDSGDLVDIRKYSLGGESITLFSRSPDRETTVDDFLMQEKTNEFFQNEQKELAAFDSKDKELFISNQEEFEKTLRKKKSKKKLRRTSKDDVESLEAFSSVRETLDAEESEIRTAETGAKKKIKRKKKVVISEATTTSNSSSLLNSKTDTFENFDKNKSNPPEIPPSISPSSSISNKITSISELSKTTSSTSQTLKTEMRSLVMQSASKSKTPERVASKSPEPIKSKGLTEESTGTNKRAKLERNDSTGVYELIKDGSMYPWF